MSLSPGELTAKYNSIITSLNSSYKSTTSDMQKRIEDGIVQEKNVAQEYQVMHSPDSWTMSEVINPLNSALDRINNTISSTVWSRLALYTDAQIGDQTCMSFGA